MQRVREAVKRLGISGTVSVVGLGLFIIFYLTGYGRAALLDALVIIPFAILFAIRGFLQIKRHSLWSLRNRLLLTYGLFGVLPLILVFTLVGLGSWALMNELAIYLASSALDRRIDSINSAVETIRRIPSSERLMAAPHIQEAFNASFPGLMIYIKDASGLYKFPPDAPAVTIPSAWKTTRGLLVSGGHFFGWSHYADPNLVISVIAPLTNQ